MPYEVGVEDIALLIRPLGNGRIETCIYKDPDNILDEDELDEALQVAVTMSAFFELALDDSTGIMETLKEQLNDKMHEIMSMNSSEYEDDVVPLYTSEGNVLRINRFTKTKGNC
jgi:predicted RNA-binding protein associated with RNAse of E/G family|tara:strand:- start:418 stop:759 length:342 start_codon:yes stop_codon:yes gene_type:complete